MSGFSFLNTLNLIITNCKHFIYECSFKSLDRHIKTFCLKWNRECYFPLSTERTNKTVHFVNHYRIYFLVKTSLYDNI